VLFGGSGQLIRGSGLVRVGPKLHMVQGPLPDPNDSESMAISVITQRQAIGKEQREEVRFVCEKCDRRLFAMEYDATPPKRGTCKGEGATAFLTIIESVEAAKRFNEDAAARKCKHCGHENPPFPSESWGWAVYASQAEIARRSLAAIEAAATMPPPSAGHGEAKGH
jgi:hypothetical protein